MLKGASAARARSVLIHVVKILNKMYSKHLSVLIYFWKEYALFPYTSILAVFIKYTFNFSKKC